MAVQAAIVLADGQAVPVSKTFNPRGVNTTTNGKRYALWREQSALNAAGFLVLSELYSLPGTSGVEKLEYTIKIPTLQTVGTGASGTVPVPQELYATIARVGLVVPQVATQAELKDIVAYVKNFTASAYFSNAVLSRDPAW